jgi:hypothetical protein
MCAHQRGVVRPERCGQRLALLLELDVARVGMGRDAALPTRRARPHRHERHALHHGEGDRELHVAVQHRRNIRAALEDFEMDRQLARRLPVALDHLAVVADEQDRTGRDLRARGRADLDREGLAAGNARRHVAAVVEDARGLQEPRNGGNLQRDLVGGGRGGRTAWARNLSDCHCGSPA